MTSLALLTATNITGKQDIVSISWFQQQFVQFTPQDIVLVLLFALFASVLIALVYKKTFRGVLYNPSFSITLVLLTMVTSSVVMAIGSNVALSMGMVGALSIVRFRTAVKDPIDTGYMFWSITMGILIGTKYYLPAMVVVVGISTVMLLASFVRIRTSESYLLVVHFDPIAEQEIDAELHRSVKNYRVRSKTITRSGAEMTVELQLSQRSDVVGDMLDISGVHDATLVSCQNETAF